MESASLIVAVFAALLSVGSTVAAWRAVRPRPALTGRFVGTWQGPANDNTFTLIGMHIVLTNRSTHPVYPLGVTLKVKIANKWFTAGRIARYQVEDLAEIKVSDGNSGDWAFQVAPRCVTSLLESKVEHGAPLVGFFLFYLNNQNADIRSSGGGTPIDEYELTIIDVFGRKHSFEASQNEMEVLQDGYPSLTEVLHEMGLPARRSE